MATILLYGDTQRHPALRHEVPLDIVDPFLVVERDGRPHVLTNALEEERIAGLLPDAQLLLIDELGIFELLADGYEREEAEIEVMWRAVERWGVTEAVVPGDLPVAVADRLRREGVAVAVDWRTVQERRRRKTPTELDGIHRAQRAAEAGMRAAEQLIHGATPGDDGLLHHDGEVLTAERVRAAMREACAALDAPAPPDIMVASAASGGGHDPGAGPLPAHLPITVDLWPRDDATGCWADMTRTFVGGDVPAEVAELRVVVADALRAAKGAIRPGVSGRAVYDAAADVIERAGHPTQRTRKEGEQLRHGFYFALGHGVGLEVHEPPMLGLSGIEQLVAGDVLALEPGVEGLARIGGVRYEDLVLVTEDGCETLTQFPYEL